jgi:hypothetical protein
VMGAAYSRLIGRYQDKRNGAVRLLAWQFVLTASLVMVGLTTALSLGILALLLPSRLNGLSEWWEVEIARLIVWYYPFAMFVIVTVLMGIAAVKLYVGWRLQRYYDAENNYDETNHPRRRKEDVLVRQEAGRDQEGH